MRIISGLQYLLPVRINGNWNVYPVGRSARQSFCHQDYITVSVSVSGQRICHRVGQWMSQRARARVLDSWGGGIAKQLQPDQLADRNSISIINSGSSATTSHLPDTQKDSHFITKYHLTKWSIFLYIFKPWI